MIAHPTMRSITLLAALLLASLAGQAQDPSALARQLTFETEHPGGAPSGWSINPSGSAVVDDKVVRSGRWSARIDRAAGSAADFSGILTTVPLDVAGKTITLRGFLRTEGVTGYVALWLREDGAASSLGFDSTQGRQVKGTNDWQEHAVSVQIQAEGRQLIFGVLISGTGKVWADDLELLVDGKPFSAAPKVERPKTALDTDREFDGGSGLIFDTFTRQQVDNLTTLGKIWGFIKYHHPVVRSGKRHWDYDLFRVLPTVLAAPDRDSNNAAIAKWITSLGAVPPCGPCATVRADTLHLGTNLDWISDRSSLGASLSDLLRSIYANRPATPDQFYLSLTPGVGNPVFTNEPTYANVPIPDGGFQLLALYRFWNIVEYWFPYRDVIGENWDGVLREFISKVATAKAAPEYQRQLMALIARIHDTHANLWSSLAVRPPMGNCQLPVTVRFVEDRAVVTSGGGGLEIGDVITALDGVPLPKLIQDWSPYYAASNLPTRLRDIGRGMTRGPCGEAPVGVARGNGETTVKVARVPPSSVAQAPATHDLAGDTFRKLSKDVAYLKLSSIRGPDVAGYIDAAAGTKGLVIDIRNYPSTFVVFTLGQLLVSDEVAFARFTGGDLVNPGAFHWGPTVSLKPAPKRYVGKVVILIDEVSQSQAEYTTMAFRTAQGARIVGSTTAGADGNVSPIPLPGGLRSMISGIGVFYPDKRPTQRIGIVPDVEVRPTIAGIRAGRDEVLEAAIREILGPGVALAEIQKMISGR